MFRLQAKSDFVTVCTINISVLVYLQVQLENDRIAHMVLQEPTACAPNTIGSAQIRKKKDTIY